MAEVARLAGRLRDPDAVTRNTELARARTSGPYFFQPESLTSGFPGIALFYAHLAAARPGAGWDEAAREFISRAAAATRGRPLSRPGLYPGSAGFAFTLRCMTALDSRYAATAARLADQVALRVLREHPRPGGYGDVVEMDVISGDAGVLATLLTVPDPSDTVRDAIGALIRDLVTLCLTGDETGTDQWLVYSGLPDGSAGGFAGWYDLGLSHGVLGPATALALARAAGEDAAGMTDAIEHVRAWVTGHRIEDDDGVRWPAGYLPGEGAARRARRRARPAWCYGGVGVARALWLIGRALDDAGQQRFALRAARSAVEQVVTGDEPRGATLCHGTTGVLQCCLRFVADTGDERLRSFIRPLAERVLASCDPALPFIVSEERADGQWVDDPGFLAGAAGTGLALISLSTEVTPRWDRALLMS
jgi:lantibiotic modifying enzyme